MKIARVKKSQRYLDFYVNNFRYKAPFQILIDATFCNAALTNKVAIEEQLRKYLQHDVKLVTTHCIIAEAENLGPMLLGAALLVKQFNVHKCGHEGNAVSARRCILNLIETGRYFVASQDRHLQNTLRNISGQGIIYLHRCTPVLEAPSIKTKEAIRQKNVTLPKNVEENLKHMKRKEGIKIEEKIHKKKKNFPKNPNPLSCKKKTSKRKSRKRKEEKA